MTPELVQLISATLDYHWAEFAGAVIPGKRPFQIRRDFDNAVMAYRTTVGLNEQDKEPS